MRWLLIAITLVFLGATPALGKPKVAVTVDGDADGKMGEAVRDLLGGKLSAVASKDVERAMSKLGVSGELEEDDAEKLGKRLDAPVVVQGKLGKSGKKKTVKLTVFVRGKKPSDFNVQYKSVESDKFRAAVRKALLKRIGSIDDLEEGDKPKPKRKPAGGDGDGDGDKPKPKRKIATGGDDDGKPKTRKRRGGDDGDDGGDDGGDGPGVREAPARPLPAVRVDAGLSYAARYLTYKVGDGATQRPPKVFTPAASGRFEGEIYPLALANRKGALAGLGIFGEYDKTFGLSIDVPNTMSKSTPINQAHYAVGVRYRLPLGKAAISGGLAYARRHYIADRGSLEAAEKLDMPDVDYSAVSPVIGARAQLGAKLALFTEVSALLVLSAGAIAESANYGAGNVFGIGGHAGVDYALGKQIGLRLAAEYNQVNLSFKGNGMLSAARKVDGATDRDFGAVLTFAAMY